jgi:hypothetical protein
MPGKSKHGKRKHFRPSKKSKQIMRQDTAAAPVPTAAVATKPPAPAPGAAAGKAAASPMSVITEQYGYVPGDLRRIGFLSGIVIVILFILYFFLS